MDIQRVKAILFDLDGTLLNNDMDEFLERYYARLTARFTHLVSFEIFMKAMNKAARAMVANQGPRSNAEVFDEIFFPLVGFSREDTRHIFDDFYAVDFPKLYLEEYFDPQAPVLIQKARQKGYVCVVATNPLFPEVATRHRMNWAGLDAADFALVTTYENSHAAKPSLKYYRDILDFIDQPAEACLMVGDQAWDMVAAELGMQTFLVHSATSDITDETPAPTAEGTLSDLAKILG
jgi:FMN phosphatase YigB (HAD superfamily)